MQQVFQQEKSVWKVIHKERLRTYNVTNTMRDASPNCVEDGKFRHVDDGFFLSIYSMWMTEFSVTNMIYVHRSGLRHTWLYNSVYCTVE
jgi:hypothetical protein